MSSVLVWHGHVSSSANEHCGFSQETLRAPHRQSSGNDAAAPPLGAAPAVAAPPGADAPDSPWFPRDRILYNRQRDEAEAAVAATSGAGAPTHGRDLEMSPLSLKSTSTIAVCICSQ